MLFDFAHETHFYSLIPGHEGASLGHEYLINDAGAVTVVSGASSRGNLGATGTTSGGSSAPAPTLIGSPAGLQIDLVWDASVAKAPSGFTQAVIKAAEYYTTLYSNHETVTIDVGYGEIAGSSMAANALGESESYGYLTNFQTITAALGHDGFVFSAINEPTNGQFFLTSAEAKALGLVSNPGAGLDGYVGFSTLNGTGYSWNMTASPTGSNTGTGVHQFDLQSVALHEISEVMGRVGMEGELINGKATYTPLDLFNFKSPGALELSGNGGYFSVNDGFTALGTFNHATLHGGDVADWASASSPTSQSQTLGLPGGVNVSDAYDAFLFPNYNGAVSQSDILELTALGYKLTPSGKTLA